MLKCDLRFDDIVSVENLCAAWEEFIVGKKSKMDVCTFQRQLTKHIMELHQDLDTGEYRHGAYYEFRIADPKPRVIHKASVRDRLVHHAIHRTLYPFFDRLFIADSFACRQGKGLHRAMRRFRDFSRKAGRNHSRTVWILKCDIRKFFASVDHLILLGLLRSRIEDDRIVTLLAKIILSFQTQIGKGIPLGNLTSQLFANVYLNELDQFVKHGLHIPFYIRYADDFVFLDHSREGLRGLIPNIEKFLHRELRLSLHPSKIFVQTVASGIDFLGWIHFPHHRVLRTSTKKRMYARIREQPSYETLQSYLGLLGHGDAHGLEQQCLNDYWLWSTIHG